MLVVMQCSETPLNSDKNPLDAVKLCNGLAINEITFKTEEPDNGLINNKG